MTFEEKMKIVINNYFKTECSVNTSIREAFEKGFRIGASKVQKKHGRWVNYSPVTIKCSQCGHVIHDWRYSECKYCPNCGAKMDAQEEE